MFMWERRGDRGFQFECLYIKLLWVSKVYERVVEILMLPKRGAHFNGIGPKLGKLSKRGGRIINFHVTTLPKTGL